MDARSGFLSIVKRGFDVQSYLRPQVGESLLRRVGAAAQSAGSRLKLPAVEQAPLKPDADRCEVFAVENLIVDMVIIRMQHHLGESLCALGPCCLFETFLLCADRRELGSTLDGLRD